MPRYSQSKKKYLNCADGNESCLFQLSDITADGCFVTSGPNANAVLIGKNMYLSTTVDNFILSLNEINSSNLTYASYYETSFLDLGREIKLGIVGSESNYITLRLIKRLNGSTGSFGDSQSTAYIVTENKLILEYGKLYSTNFYIGGY